MTPICTPSVRRLRRCLPTLAQLALSLLVNAGLAGTACAAIGGLTHAGSTDHAVAYPMTAEGWTMAPPIGWAGKTAGSATFARYEGMPAGTMTLNEGIATLNAGTFSDGQIDFDIKPLGYDDAGLIFRRRGQDDGEFVYVRANPDCPAADDCVQYAPITHTLMQWNIYPNYQGSAPISPTGWNHVSIRIAGSTMLVYVNYAIAPCIVVPRLRGLTSDGGIALKGPAIYANLVIRPHTRPDVRDVTQEPVAPGTVTQWVAARPTAQDRAHPVSATDIPPSYAWHRIAVEPSGLVNLSRAFGEGQTPSVSTGWLKTIVTESEPVRRTIHIGFAMQGSVFVNGQRVFSGNNPYTPSKDRLSLEGRIQIDNATIPLDLRRGKNEIVLAVGNDWRADLPVPKPSQYGWAAEARFDSEHGLDMP